MKYAVLKFVNGSWEVPAEDMELNAAYVNYHQLCAALRNEKTVDVRATVRIIDEQLNYVEEESITVIQPKPEQPQGE